MAQTSTGAGAAQQINAELEAAGQYVRTKRMSDGSGGFMVADCGLGELNQECARLFAVAPRLLEALRHAESWISGAPHGDNCFVSAHYEGDPGDRCNCGRDSALEAVQAAIATATAAEA